MATGDGAGGKAGVDKQRLSNVQETGKSKPGLFLFNLLFCSGVTPGRALGTKCGARDCLHARLCILIPVLSLVLPQNHFFFVY